MPKITINTTDGSALEFELSADRYRIGRAQDNDLVVPDGSVSSYHGEIIVQGNSIEFNDLGSTNGTHVNGQRVENATINPGEDFRIGSCPVLLHADAATQPAYEPAADDAAPAASDAPDIGSSWQSPSMANQPAAVITGLGTTPCPTHLRSGFGPKAKRKQGGGALIALGVLGIVTCIAAAVMILQMGA